MPSRPGDGITVMPSAAESVPDAAAVIEDLQRRLMVERETALNSVDAMLGARAKEAQAKAENKDLLYRLHVREAELMQLKELLDRDPKLIGSGDADAVTAPGHDSTVGGEAVEVARAAKALFRAARTSVRRP